MRRTTLSLFSYFSKIGLEAMAIVVYDLLWHTVTRSVNIENTT